MKKSTTFKLIALFLTIAIVFTTMPVVALAQKITYEEEKPAYIVGEIESMRTETEKVFRMSDGKMQMAIYNVPIHFENEDGEWEQINNKLKSQDSDTYTTKNTSQDISLSKKYKSGKTVEITTNDTNISWGFVDANKASAEIVEQKSEGLEGDEKFTAIPNAVSTTIYKDIYDNIDAEYIITGGQVKENLILNKETDQNEFEIEYRYKKLTPVQKDDKTIELQNSKGKPVYTITAPIMTDDNGALSDDLKLKIVSDKDNKLTVNLIADKEWLQDKERDYPVTIDPQIGINDFVYTPTNISISAASISDVNNVCEYNSAVRVNINCLPNIAPGAYITDTVLNLYTNNSYSEDLPIYFIGDANASSTEISYSNFNQYAEDICDASYSTNSASWNITNSFQQLYTTQTTNSALSICYAIASTSDNLYNDLGYSPTSQSFSLNPTLQITYINQSGLNEKYSYHEFDMEAAGTLYYNDLTIEPIVKRDDFSVETSSGSVDIGMTYTTNFNYRIGVGSYYLWKPNYFESVSYYPDNSSYKYVWNTDDGEVIYFNSDGNGNFIDEGGNGYTLTDTTVTDANGNSVAAYVITTPDSKVFEFTKNGRNETTLNEKYLTKIYESGNRETALNIEYNSTLRISKLTDSDGNEYVYTYAANDSNTLISVECEAQDKLVEYTYTDNELTGVTCGDSTVNYEYRDNEVLPYNLYSIVLPNDYKLVLGDVNSSYGRSITEYGYDSDSNEWVQGSRLGITRYPAKTVYTQLDANDNGTYAEMYRFDKNGYLASVFNGDGYAINQNADKEGIVFANTEITIPVVNLINDSSFEKSTSAWSLTNASVQTKSDTANNAYFGKKWLEINNTSFATAKASQTVTGLSTGTYTFSAYVKTAENNKIELDENNTIYDGVSIRATVGENTKKATGISGEYGDWTRVYVTFDVTENNSSATLELGLYNAKGNIYIDAVQLEKHKRAYDYNAVENADFSNNTAWTTPSRVSITSNTKGKGGLDNNVLKLQGDTDRNVVSEQTLYLAQGQEGLSLSAWIQVDGMLPDIESDYKSKISVVGINNGVETVLGSSYIDFALNVVGGFTNDFVKIMTPIDKITNDYDTYKLRIEYNHQQGFLYLDGVEVMSGVMNVTETEEDTTTDDTTTDTSTTPTSVFDEYDIESGYSPVESINTFNTFTGVADCDYLVNGTVVNTTNENGETVKDETASTAYLNNSWGVTESKDEYTYTNADGNTVTDGGIAIPENALNNTTQSGICFWYKSAATFDLNLRSGTSANATTDYSVALEAAPTGTWKTILYKDIEADGKDINDFNYIHIKTTTSPVYIDEIYTVLADSIIYTDDEYEDDEGYEVSESYETSRDGKTMKTASASKSLTLNGISCIINRETDSLGVNTFTTTEEETGNQISATDGNGNTVNYSYDDINNLVEMSQTVDETDISVNYTYDNKGNISTITNGNVTYTYKYTPFGDLKSIYVGTTALITYSYISNQNRQASKLTYANGHTVNYNYNADGVITSVVYKDSNNNVTDTITYTNDEVGEILKTTDNVNQTVSLTYLEETQVWNLAETELLYSYSSNDESFSETLNGTKFTTTYSSQDTTDETTALETSETTSFGGLSKTVYSDAFGRVTKEETKNGDTVVSNKEYTYINNGDYVTDRILTEKVTAGGVTCLYNQYSYDNNGNITLIENLRGAGSQDTYEYDELGQLVKENTTSYVYDTYGNITKKGAFTYYYEDNNWKDKLTKRVNQAFVYDESGNPTTYLGATLTWKNGRQLASYTKGTKTVTYEYNESGLRTKKTVNKNGTITTYNYTWSDSKLTHQVWGNCYLHFYYDYSDEIVGFEYFDGTNVEYYTYVKNMQGDIVAIIDSDGVIDTTYEYDAWGKFDGSSGGLDTINPIRYRGYYYDEEISMYYLQSRYYDPMIGRFINADDVELLNYAGFAINSNLYSYCDNDIVNCSDPSGLWKWKNRKYAICEPGDTRWNLAKEITGHGYNWRLLNKKAQSEKLYAGTKINILPLLYIWYQNQIKKNCSNSKKAYTVSFDGKTLKINVNVLFHHFHGEYRTLLMKQAVDGIKDWGGTYRNVLGNNKVKVVVKVNYTNENNKVRKSGYVNIFLNEPDENGDIYPRTLWLTPNTNKKSYKMVLYSRSENFANTARHEFGHCLGLDDAYFIDENHVDFYKYDMPYKCAMRHDGDPIPQEISMIIVGLAENKNQNFPDGNETTKTSTALTYYY